MASSFIYRPHVHNLDNVSTPDVLIDQVSIVKGEQTAAVPIARRQAPARWPAEKPKALHRISAGAPDSRQRLPEAEYRSGIVLRWAVDTLGHSHRRQAIDTPSRDGRSGQVAAV